MTAHHAVVYEGDRSAGSQVARSYIEDVLGVRYRSNPDVCIIEGEQCTIHDVRALKDRAYRHAFGVVQVFIIAFDRFTVQAQNALLKLLEEPASNTHVVLLIPTLEHFIPTVRSRLEYGGAVRAEHPPELPFARDFLRASPEERIALLGPLTKSVPDAEKPAARSRASRILDALESSLEAYGPRTHADSLREVLFVRRYLVDTSSSLKMLFEHLAITLDRVA